MGKQSGHKRFLYRKKKNPPSFDEGGGTTKRALVQVAAAVF